MNSNQKKELTKRVKYVVGHLSAIEEMIADDRDSSEILAQLRSVESAFRKSILQTFEDVSRLELAERIVEALEKCPGPCQYCDVIEMLKKDFPNLTLAQVVDAMHRVPGKQSSARKGVKGRKA